MSPRRAGVLLHPTSLPGPWGVGDLGPAAEDLLDWLARAGQSVWQMLPLGPTGFCGSPYSGLSAFAGNPLLISPQRLLESELLHPEDMVEPPVGAAVDFPAASAFKEELLGRAFERFEEGASEELTRQLQAYLQAPEQASWLEDWALFCTLRRQYPNGGWWEWPAPLAQRNPQALAQASQQHSRELRYHRFVQFLFDVQWRRLRSLAQERGVLLLGDVPMYVARDSADVWAHRELFQLDGSGAPLAVAGVPPDDFSETGQLWGNPLYDWQAMRSRGFAWWGKRVAADLRRFDLLRLDHFRGFEAYWSVPAAATTAEAGSWEPGPGEAFFESLRRRLGWLPFVAENLGVITAEVEQLRRRFALPGTAVLQFAFGDDGMLPEHTPRDLPPENVIYTGTHDNPTTAAWYRSLPPALRRQVDAYCGVENLAFEAAPDPRTFLRCVYASPAELAIVPVQDLLGLGDEARMNTPGVADGNWRWRLEPGALTAELAAELAELMILSGRLPGGGDGS